jgi:hypothetical protein
MCLHIGCQSNKRAGSECFSLSLFSLPVYLPEGTISGAKVACKFREGHSFFDFEKLRRLRRQRETVLVKSSSLSHLRFNDPARQLQYTISSEKQAVMADALKAEGNKLFAAKDFTGAVYVHSCPIVNFTC